MSRAVRSVMHTSVGLVAAPYLLAFCACVACSSSEPGADGEGRTIAGAGGAAHVASAGSATTGGASGGPSGGAAGIPGAGSSSCGEFNGTGVNCGSCVRTLGEYCDVPDKCYLMHVPECKEGIFTQHVEEGCGYVKISWSGDVGDRGVSIYEDRNLVYDWDNGRRSAGCLPDIRVGEEPECDQWTDACAQGGADGAAGAGNAAP